MISLRLIFGDRSSLETMVHETFCSRVAGGERAAHDNIIRTDVAFTVRIHRQHAAAIRYLLSRRDTSSASVGDISQSNASVGLYYVYLGDDGFGAVEWRRSDEH
jgi:hypothetical protein